MTDRLIRNGLPFLAFGMTLAVFRGDSHSLNSVSSWMDLWLIALGFIAWGIGLKLRKQQFVAIGLVVLGGGLWLLGALNGVRPGVPLFLTSYFVLSAGLFSFTFAQSKWADDLLWIGSSYVFSYYFVYPFAPRWGIPIVLLFIFFLLGLLRRRFSTETIPSEEADWVDAFGLGLFLSGALVLIWSRIQIFSGGAVGTILILFFCLSVWTLLVRRTNFLSLVSSSYRTYSLTLLSVSLLVLPALLSKNQYPRGVGSIALIWYFLLIAILSLPLVLRSASELKKSANFENLIAVGGLILIGFLLSNAIHPVYLFAVSIFGSLLILWIQNKKRIDWIKFGIPFVLLILLVVVERDRFNGKANEIVIEGKQFNGDQFFLLKSQKDGDIRIRKNHHRVITSYLGYDRLRRHTLIPLLLRVQPKRALVIGAGNPMGVSALLEKGKLDSIDIVDSNPVLFDWFKWFLTKEASFGATQTRRIVADPIQGVSGLDQEYDLIVIEAFPPWEQGAKDIHSKQFYELIREKMAPNAVVAQWFFFDQWSQKGLSRVWEGFSKTFSGHIGLWRSDLLPRLPTAAFIVSPDQFKIEPNRSKVTHVSDDGFLTEVGSVFTFLLAENRSIEQAFERAQPILISDTSFSLRSSWSRWMTRNLMKGEDLLGMGNDDSTKNRRSMGALAWTRAIVMREKGEGRWKDFEKEAIQLLGFDPKTAYPKIFPKEKKQSK